MSVAGWLRGDIVAVSESRKDFGQFMELVSLVRPPERKAEMEHAQAKLVSTFDMDDPCIVFTLYDAYLEVLWRQDRRGMSVCWVVEEVQSVDRERESDAEQCNVQDKSEALNINIPLTVRETSAGFVPQGEVTWKEEQAAIRKAPSEKLDTYRVGNCLRGAWEAMDEPAQEYMFV